MDDAGYYMIKAINIEGETKCECVLNVLSSIDNLPMMTEQINIQSEGFPPFLQLFVDQHTSVNSTVKFQARLIGTQPEFLQLFVDQHTSVNSTVKFQARLIGTQPFNVKNEKEILFKKKKSNY